MRYINKEKNIVYNGGSFTYRISERAVFSGVPSVEQLTQWGFEEIVETPYVPTEADAKRQRMGEILDALQASDYLALKAFEGEDMSDHPNWKEDRAALREEYRQLEAEVEALEAEENNE